MLSPDELRRLLGGCRTWLRAAGLTDGETPCTAALDDRTDPRPPVPFETAGDDWATLSHAHPAALLGIALHAAPDTGRQVIALQARLTGCVQADDLATGAGVLHAALVAGLGRRPTVSRALDLLPLAATPEGGFGRAFLATGACDAATTLRCAWALAEAHRPGVTRRLAALPPGLAVPLAAT